MCVCVSVCVAFVCVWRLCVCVWRLCVAFVYSVSYAASPKSPRCEPTSSWVILPQEAAVQGLARGTQHQPLCDGTSS